MTFQFEGLMAPVFATYRHDSTKSLNVDIIIDYARYLNDKGIKGILVNGTSGEGMSMNVAERKLIVEAWIKAAKTLKADQHVMVQVGGASLPDVLEMAKHAEQTGANSLLCLPDLYNKPQNISQLINYLKIVSKAAPNTPLLYYHIPMFTNVNIHMGKFLQEMGNQIPTFSGIKFTSNDLDEGISAVKANNGKFSVLLGADTLMVGAYAMGFKSSIATTLNICPTLGASILKDTINGNIQSAQNIQRKLSAIVATITKYGTWVPTMKAAMNIISPIDCGPVRDPLINLTNEEITTLTSELSSIF